MGRTLNEGGFAVSPSLLRVLMLMSFFSGCAALIYEIVWFQLLQLTIGNSAVSLGVLLGTYMGGMCLGSFILPRFISHRWNSLRVCSLLEVGIGLMGILVLFLLPSASVLYSKQASGSSGGIALRACLAAGCLLPPTILMGATLPAIARWVGSTSQGVSRLSSIYGCNVIGAVFGCLLSGFYLLRIHDTGVATYLAVAINGAVALTALAVSFSTRCKAEAAPEQSGELFPDPLLKNSTPKRTLMPVYVAIAFSGATALGAEVIWTRLLSLMLGSTVYTFSIILAVFLGGIGIGNHVGVRIVQRAVRPDFALGWCQLLLTVAIAWTAYMLAESLPYWPVATLSSNPWLNFQMSLSHCLWALLPATLLWGASFPLALAAAAHGQDPARLFGGVSAANTLGGLVGGVGFSMALIPVQGMQHGQRILIVFAAFASILLLAPLVWERRQKFSFVPVLRGALILLVLIGLPFFCVRSVSKIPGALMAFGRNVQWMGGKSELLFVGEGNSYPVGVSQLWNSNVRVFHVSGKIEASTLIQDMRLQRLLGHLPALLHPKPESVLVVGCGTGVTAGSFTLYPDVKKIVICELEPLVPPIADEYFARENYGVLKDRRTQTIYDDARHYILTTDEKFDIITSDPIHPWVKGSANLYTKEYFDLVKSRLNRGGIVTQWVPLYQSDISVVKSELATFFEVFPNGTIWSSDQPGQGSDIVLLGQYGGCQIKLDEMEQRMEQAGYSRVVQSLREVGFDSVIDVCGGYSGRARDLAVWLYDSQINYDQNLRLQYLAGFTLNEQQNNAIYNDLITYRQFPDSLFIGSPQTKAALNRSIFRPESRAKHIGG